MQDQSGGVNVSDEGRVEVGQDLVGRDKVTDSHDQTAGGDIIIANVGADAQNVAVGKNISISVRQTTAADDSRLIAQQFAEAAHALQGLEAPVAAMAAFQLKLLQGELIKTDPPAVPSANTITQVGDWLLDNAPQTTPLLKTLFQLPAVKKALGRAGAPAVEWARQRLGA